MGWRTDWLYGCLFEYVETLWRACQKSAMRGSGTPPEIIYILQGGNADWNRPVCKPPLLRAWRYDASGLQKVPIPIQNPYAHEKPHGMFYRAGSMAFHIREDRKYVALVYVVGPLYARGYVYKVIGQGKHGKYRGRLELAEGFPMWVA